jgi:restriction endonuclease Mrr
MKIFNRKRQRGAGVVIVTTGHFTSAARAFAKGKSVKLIDGTALLELIRRHQTPTPSDQA